MTAIEVARIFGVDVGSRRAKIKGGYLALCPVHSDSKPSLTIKDGKRCVLVGCLSHNCDLADICKAVGISRRSLWYDSETKLDAKAYAEAQRKRREHERAEAENKLEMRYWANETQQWERAAALLFTHMLTLESTPQAQRVADLWHKVLYVARERRERLWGAQKASGVDRVKFGEVDCFIASETNYMGSAWKQSVLPAPSGGK